MTTLSLRRFAITAALGTSMLASAGVAVAQTGGVTGTDPCPKGYACTVSPSTTTSSTATKTTSTSTSTSSTSGATFQTLLAMLGLA